MTFKIFMLLIAIGITFTSCAPKTEKRKPEKKAENIVLEPRPGEGVATFASGCFWCVEEIYESLVGVREVISGYSGGTAGDANYDAVSRGSTDHAESVQIYYDTAVISFEELTKVFFDSHDPTTLNQQGPDRGTQYRSVAFYRNEAERDIILKEILKITQSEEYNKPIVTQVVQFTAFYPAENYHQDYIVKHPNEPYVRGVSIPRYEEFKKKYKGKLKD